MRGYATPVTLAEMSPDSSVKVMIDLARCAETICGEITVAGRDPAAFFGWLELMGRLDRALEDLPGPSRAGVDPP